MPGVKKVDVKVGEKDFTVNYEPGKATIDSMLTALKNAGEIATAVQ